MNEDLNSIEKSEVSIGAQVWMLKNLYVEKFRNGDPLKEVKTNEEWEKAGENCEPAWCYYENDPANGEKYGKIYNGYAVIDPRGLAPNGWKIPSEIEWTKLCKFLGGEKIAGIKMKSTSEWDVHSIPLARRCGTNESGFTGLPGGYRNNDGTFCGVGKDCSLWSSTDMFGRLDLRAMDYAESCLMKSSLGKSYGFYVRCLKD